MKLLMINGPNLNLLGKRQPEIYGNKTIIDLEEELASAYKKVQFVFYQSNHEGDIVDRLQKTLSEDFSGIIINPGALTHYSIALYDALKSIDSKVIEVHISNIYAREDFRNKSLISPVVKGVISGFDFIGYHLAVEYFIKSL